MLLTVLKAAAARPFNETVYSIRYGLPRGLKRKGGLGFLARSRPLTVEESFLAQVPLEGRTVYDVGCLDGMYTLFFARAVGPSGRVVAFEPNPRNCETIADNLALNDFTNVDVHDVGLGTRSEVSELVIPFGAPGQGTVNGELQRHYLQQSRTTRVPIRIEPLDTYRHANAIPPPDVIKIDVEGFELQVLEGATSTLEEFKPKLFIELHGLEPSARLQNVRRVIELLGSVGYNAPLHVETGRAVDSANPPYEGHLWAS